MKKRSSHSIALVLITTAPFLVGCHRRMNEDKEQQQTVHSNGVHYYGSPMGGTATSNGTATNSNSIRNGFGGSSPVGSPTGG